jgi:hypothetical protein
VGNVAIGTITSPNGVTRWYSLFIRRVKDYFRYLFATGIAVRRDS